MQDQERKKEDRPRKKDQANKTRLSKKEGKKDRPRKEERQAKEKKKSKQAKKEKERQEVSHCLSLTSAVTDDSIN